ADHNGRPGRVLQGHTNGVGDLRGPARRQGRRGVSQDRSQTLRAGGIVPRGTELGSEVVDRMVTHGYRHPALPGRAVVRLAADPTVATSDIEMAILGFGEAEDRGAVNQERRRALGFPGWALVHDPDNARHALEVVQELKQCAR